MRFSKFLFLCVVVFLLSSCGGGGSSSSNVPSNPTPTLKAITVSPTNVSGIIGTTQQFSAIGTYSDATTSNLTDTVTWSSSDASIANISSGGLAGLQTAGTTKITAALGTISGSTTLTVVLKSLISIDISPLTPSVPSGTSAQFSAIGTFNDATILDMTSQVTWSSSDTLIATIGNSDGSKGLATSLAVGITNITAQFGSISGSTQLTVTPASSIDNTMLITVNGTLCSANSISNKPCVNITICSPASSNCQTISDILLDTGSYGLRLFSDVITVPLTQTTVGGSPLAECVQFADGSADWGPVKLANVILGGEPAVTVPIQVIDATFGNVPTVCGVPETSPAYAGLNGILGVGPFTEDCGTACSGGSNNGTYFTCNGTSCRGVAVPFASQVQNPVPHLPLDNNGMIIKMPSVPSGGTIAVNNGQLIFGINTRSNNVPNGVTAYPADSTGSFTTIYNGIPDSNSFIDSGSNGLFFNNSSPQIAECFGSYAGWYCPASTLTLTATNRGSGGSPSGSVVFKIGNARTLFNTSSNVFTELGGTNTYGFDWGLPFFLGRSVYVGISGRGGSILGNGPYWAY